MADDLPPGGFGDDDDEGASEWAEARGGRPKLRVVGDDEGALSSDDHATLSAELIKAIDGAIYSEERFWRYSNEMGTWADIPERELGAMVQSWSGRQFVNSDGKTRPLRIDDHDVNGTLNCARRLLNRPDFFLDAVSGVCFTNGFLKLDGAEVKLVAHSPDHKARHAHRFAYDATASQKELLEFVDVMFSLDGEEESSAKVALLQEFAGACLFGVAPRFQRCLVICAGGGQGKSQLLKLMRATFPSATAIASLPPHMWGERFGVAVLSGRLLNACDEIPENEIVAGATFKAVVTGEPVTAERKYLPKFDFSPRAGHVFSCNALPSTGDLSQGFFDRFMLLELVKRFRDTEEARLDAAEWVIASCLPGLVAWAVHGAERLVRNGRYTVPASSKALHAVWRRDCNNVAVFAEERTRPADPARPTCAGNGTPAGALYAAYRSWAADNGYKPVNARNFANRLDAAGIAKTKQSDGWHYSVILSSRTGAQVT